jgi:NAD-dependent SIR2 family protein deacetylase
MADMLEEITHCLQAARAVVALTGAGVSAESGVPTFRDALTGLWARSTRSYSPRRKRLRAIQRW